jgi:hypothetical protein
MLLSRALLLARSGVQLQAMQRTLVVSAAVAANAVEPALASSGTSALVDLIGEQLKQMQEAGTYKVERIITTAQGPSVGKVWEGLGPTAGCALPSATTGAAWPAAPC